MVSAWLRRCTWQCLTSSNPMYLFLSSFCWMSMPTVCEKLPVAVCLRHAHHTQLVVPQILAFHNMLSVSCSHLERTFLRSFGFTQHAHFQNLDSVSALVNLRRATCITLSWISSICSSARCTRTIPLLNNLTLARCLTSPMQQSHQPSIAEFSGKDGRLHSIVDSLCFMGWISSTSSIPLLP